jgi:chorismate-pyruvate lyase
MISIRKTLGLALVAGLVSTSAGAAPWPDTGLGRVAAVAVMQALNARLLASSSATTTLEAWCGEHRMASPARLVAERVRGVEKPVTDAQRGLLQVSADEPVKYRRVRLSCGGHVLSEADNWYAPGRLTDEMNRVLETTDTPFGRAVAGLHPVRRTLSAEMLWSPLPAGWDLAVGQAPAAGGGGVLPVPAALFRHTALLYDEQRRPFSLVVETYTAAVLDYPRRGVLGQSVVTSGGASAGRRRPRR